MQTQGARRLLLIQAAYFLLTGLWPLVHMESFLAVTGPKDDVWLVETVGLLIAAMGAGFGLAALGGDVSREIIVIAMASAVGLATIDSIYVARGRIPAVYLLDAGIELVLIACWLVLCLKRPIWSR